MDKGDIVKIKAIVESKWEYTPDGTVKKIRRHVHKLPFTGVVLGYSFLKTGRIVTGNYTGNYYDEPNQLLVDKSYKVFVVEPFESYMPYSPNGERLMKNNRYLELVRCFEDDLEVVK